VIGESQKGHIYYRCHTQGCPTAGFREEVLDRAIRTRFQPLGLNEREMCYLLSRVERLRLQWQEQAEDRRVALTLRLGRVQDRLRRLTDVFLDGEIEKLLFDERKETLLMERREIEDQLAASEEGREVPIPVKIQDFLELAQSAHSSYEAGLDDEKRQLIEIVTSNRTVQGKNVKIMLKEPFRLIAERAPISNGAPYRTTHRKLDEVLAGLVRYYRQEKESRVSSAI
jgi:hypothetical protein